MKPADKDGPRQSLPACAAEYIARVTRTMRYRRHARAEVDAELRAHFEDALSDSEGLEQREAKARELIAQFGDPKLLAILCRRAKKRARPLWHRILVRGTQAIALFFLYLVICSLPLFLGKPTIDVNYVRWLSEHWRPEKEQIENARTYYDLRSCRRTLCETVTGA